VLSFNHPNAEQGNFAHRLALQARLEGLSPGGGLFLKLRSAPGGAPGTLENEKPNKSGAAICQIRLKFLTLMPITSL
jgi:hypothetical protein